MAAETQKEIQLEIAHVLFIDTVGYSKLSINEQRAVVDELTKIVRATEQFQKADASDRLIKIATSRRASQPLPDFPKRANARDIRGGCSKSSV